jgi:rhodanese-related sulfurtransferase
MKKLLLLAILLCTFVANAQVDFRTAKLYKEDITSKVAYKMQQEGVILIDIRTKQEFNKIRAKDSINIPIFYAQKGKRVFNKQFINQINNQLNSDLNTKAILICRSGSRTKLASNLLASQGFTNIYNVSNGLQYDWIKVNLPTVE